jgi:hypothetical protein
MPLLGRFDIVEHVATGRPWTDHEGYERERAAIERTTDAEW